MLQIVQAYDRSPIAEVPADGADALEAKLDLAARAFRDRDRWAEAARAHRPAPVSFLSIRQNRKIMCNTFSGQIRVQRRYGDPGIL